MIFGAGRRRSRGDCALKKRKFIPNVKNLLSDDSRIIDVYWNDNLKNSYNAEIEIYANDRDGLLKDVMKQIETTKAKLIAVSAKANRAGIALIEASLELQSKDELEKVVKVIKNVYSVYEVKRRK